MGHLRLLVDYGFFYPEICIDNVSQRENLLWVRKIKIRGIMIVKMKRVQVMHADLDWAGA